MGTVTNFPARQAEPGQRFNTRDAEQGEIDLVADEDGIVQPQTLAEHRAAELFRIPLAEGHDEYAGPLYTHPPEAEEEDEDAPDPRTREELRDRAKELGIATGGNKTELAERIAAAEAAQGGGDNS